jgi:hypothetical protein
LAAALGGESWLACAVDRREGEALTDEERASRDAAKEA